MPPSPSTASMGRTPSPSPAWRCSLASFVDTSEQSLPRYAGTKSSTASSTGRRPSGVDTDFPDPGGEAWAPVSA